MFGDLAESKFCFAKRFNVFNANFEAHDHFMENLNCMGLLYNLVIPRLYRASKQMSESS